ncbi:MAG: cell division protein FtsQ/DivIB [Pseudohongiellaceae bacterium]
MSRSRAETVNYRRRDARVRHQLQGQAGHSGRHHQLLWLLPIGLGIVLASWVLLTATSFATTINPPVSRIGIEGKLQFVREQEIASLIAPRLGEGFFRIDVNSVKADLETHAWIASAEVKRVWPDQLAIQITEEVPIARWGESQLLNQYGQIFYPVNTEQLPNLPVLLGPPDSENVVMERYRELSELLFPVGLGLQQLSLSLRGSWELQLSDGVRVIAGRRDVTERVRRFLEIYDSQLRNDIALIESVDLRYSNGLAVKRSQEGINGVAAR